MMLINEYTEFSMDMMRGLPRAHFCAINNIPHKCLVKSNLKELYNLVTSNVEEHGNFQVDNPDSMYAYTRPDWTTYGWAPPPLKNMFKDKIKFDKPTIVINNKCGIEWHESSATNIANQFNLDTSLGQIISNGHGEVSVNHFSIPMIAKLADLVSDKYQLIYIRPITSAKYFSDHNELLDFDDFDFLEKNYPNVYTIRQFLRDTNLTDNYTIAQFILEATSDKHLTIPGGNACISAYFGGDVLIYLWEGYQHGHRKGDRGVWKTDSWLKYLGNSNIISVNNYMDILNYISNNWL